MSLASTSIKRPVLSIVMSLVIVIFGAIGIVSLPVREYPNVDAPIINVSVSYPGANADIIETQITERLEESINGIAGIRTLSSQSSDGRCRLTVEFILGTDLETAANDVRDRVSRVQRQLPADCDPPQVSKQDSDANPIIFLSVRSEKRSLLELSDIADRVFKERLQTIPGVSEVAIQGEKRYAIRILLDPIKLAAYNLTPLDVRNAVRSENVELPTGSIEGGNIELSIRTLGKLINVDQFKELIIKEEKGMPVKIKDIAEVMYAAANEGSMSKLNGVPVVSIQLIPQAGANHVEISDAYHARLEEIRKSLPDDVLIQTVYESADYIRRSLKEVEDTIIIAFVLVLLIIFIFLRSWRTTFIPIIAIPISLIGSFFIMYVMGFSINVLTLLAIVLSIGLVVDDAIVMMENIYVKVESGMHPIEAAFKGAKEIYFAIVSTTVVLVFVFLPVIFLQGLTGKLFREFGIVIAGSVLISAFVALTLSPMLSSRIISNKSSEGRLYKATEKYFQSMISGYRKILTYLMRNRWIASTILACSFVLIVGLFKSLNQELAPLEDRNRINMRVTLPEGISRLNTWSFIDELADLAYDSIPEHAFIANTAFGSGGGFVAVYLKDRSERTRTQQEIADKMTIDARTLSAGRVMVSQDPTIGDRRSGQGLSYVIQATDKEKLREVLPKFIEEASKNPKFTFVDVNLKFSKPELVIEVNRDKARSLNVTVQNVAQTLQYGMSGQRYDYFTMNGKQYEVFGEMKKTSRNDPKDLTSLYVRSSLGDLVQLDNLVTKTEKSTTPQLYRFNRYAAATVSAMLAPKVSMSEAITAMDSVSKKVLDDTFRRDLSGQARELKESSGSIYFAFCLALILVYLVLAAQFESFRDPITILMTVPLALAGALLSLWLFDQTINIFSEIGIIMLVGLVTKNGILIVEFANQRRDAGMEIIEAVKDAAASRIRPILMTSLATILGILPIALALGAGAESRVSMGIAVVGGMILSTGMTLFVIPVIYTLLTSKTRVQIKEKEYDNNPGE